MAGREIVKEVNAPAEGFFDRLFASDEYAGNVPRVGNPMLDGGTSERWETKYGGGESYNGKILHASFNLNAKISIFICRDLLWIVDVRYAGKPDFWEFFNIQGEGMPLGACCSERSRHDLEPEKIEKILDTKIENCRFWDMVQARAKELYDQYQLSQKTKEE